MANYFASLPAYRDPGGVDFSPLNQAVQNFGETNRANAMAEYQAGQNRKAEGRANAAAGRAQATFDEARGKEALDQLGGIYQAIEAAPEAERGALLQRAMPLYQRLRQRIPDFDADAQAMGVDPNDFAGMGKLIVGMGRGVSDPTRATDAPSNVREWEYFNRLTPEQRQQYLTMKRAEKYLDTGTEFTQPNPASPGQTVRTIPKNIVGEKVAEKTGAALGDAQASLAGMRSKMPGLEVVVRELDALSEKATYTLAGQALDSMRRQAGAEPRESAVARKQYISLVDNQILPLLRETFGAQFTQKEGESLKATLGDPDASPKEKQAVLKSFIEQKRRNIEAMAAEGSPPAIPSAAPANDGWTEIGGVKIREKR
jgi:hypothetical protein